MSMNTNKSSTSANDFTEVQPLSRNEYFLNTVFQPVTLHSLQYIFHSEWLAWNNGTEYIHVLDSFTVVSHYYDTAGIRKKYHYIQTIEIPCINFYCFEIVGILI